MQNLMPEPPATRIPVDEAAAAALEAAAKDGSEAAYEQAAAAHPTSSAAWAELAQRALDEGRAVTAYAYARTGYHRGLDQLRRSGWKGHGPVPWSHEGNRGFLHSLYVLSRAADVIGESDEAARCAQFVRDCDPAAADALSG